MVDYNYSRCMRCEVDIRAIQHHPQPMYCRECREIRKRETKREQNKRRRVRAREREIKELEELIYRTVADLL